MDNIEIIRRKVINSRKKWLYIHLFSSFVLLLLIEALNLEMFHELYFVYSLWMICVYGILLFAEMQYPGFNIMTVFFVGLLVCIAFPSYSYSVGLMNSFKFEAGEGNDITDFLFHTSVSNSIYFSLFLLFLTVFTKEKLFIIDINEVSKRFNLFYLSIGIYLFAILLRLIPFLELISSILASLGSSLPIMVLFLLATYCGFNAKHDRNYILFLVIIIIEVIYSMLFGFYKGNVIRPAAMYVYYYYLYCRTTNKRLINPQLIILTITFLFFLLYIVYPFMTIKRNEAGFDNTKDITEFNDVDNWNILKRVVTLDYETTQEETNSTFTDRMSSIAPSAFFYKDAYYNGYHSDIIMHSIKVMVPRFIYPDKPSGSGGGMATNYYRIRSLDPECDSATSIGPFGSAYFWGGWPAVILMSIINALVTGLLLNVCFSNLQNVFSWLVIFNAIFGFLMCYKETVDGGYASDIFGLVYAAIIYLTSRLFKNKYKTKSVYNDNYKNTI